MSEPPTTWLVGDVHGCAAELRCLLDQLESAWAPRVVLLGDLFHRGPDPWGVLELVRERGLAFLLGNHEVVLLRRLGWDLAAPHTVPELGVLDAQAVAGDSQRALELASERRPELVRFVIERHAGLFLERATLPGARPTPDGREWCAVHAGLSPGHTARDSRADDLVWPARVRGRRSPWWFERHVGPELVVFGHRVEPAPRVVRHAGRPVAVGIDTGCVLGGALTAYAPELDRFVRVPAAAAAGA